MRGGASEIEHSAVCMQGSLNPSLRIGAALFVIFLSSALPAHSQNTTFATSVHLAIGQTIRVLLASGSADRFYDAPIVQNRSYCVEANGE